MSDVEASAIAKHIGRVGISHSVLNALSDEAKRVLRESQSVVLDVDGEEIPW